MDSNLSRNEMTMKKIFIGAFALALAAMVSCNRNESFKHIPFVYFESSSISVYEDAGTVRIPVYASTDEDFTLSFVTVDGTKIDKATGMEVPNGKAGEDYAVKDNDAAIIRFNASDDVKYIEVNITDRTGVLTGNKDFTIKLNSAGNDVSLGGFSTCKVTIIDNDHPLKEILGPYAATGTSLFSGTVEEWTLTMVADPDDYFKVWFDGILKDFEGDYLSGADGRNHAIYGTFNKIDDITANLSTITIPGGQKFADPYNGNDISIVYVSGNSFSPTNDISLSRKDDGTGYVANSGWGSRVGSTNSFYEIIGSNPQPTFIKK